MDDIAEGLRRARARIADIKNWCQGSLAKNNFGYNVHPDSPNACQWCADGALISVFGRSGSSYNTARPVLRSCVADLFPDLYGEGNPNKVAPTEFSYVNINDGVWRTKKYDAFTPEECHANVLKAFDCAIKKAEAKAAASA